MCHACDRGAVKQINVVRQAAIEFTCYLRDFESQVETCGWILDLQRSQFQIREREFFRWHVLQSEEHLKQRAVAQLAPAAALPPAAQTAHPDAHTPPNITSRTRPNNSAKLASSANFVRSTSVFTKKPINGSSSARCRSRYRRSHHHVRLPRSAPQQHLPRRQQRHEQRRSFSPPQLLNAASTPAPTPVSSPPRRVSLLSALSPAATSAPAMLRSTAPASNPIPFPTARLSATAAATPHSPRTHFQLPQPVSSPPLGAAYSSPNSWTSTLTTSHPRRCGATHQQQVLRLVNLHQAGSQQWYLGSGQTRLSASSRASSERASRFRPFTQIYQGQVQAPAGFCTGLVHRRDGEGGRRKIRRRYLAELCSSAATFSAPCTRTAAGML